MRTATQSLMNIGHTSGADALAGFLAAHRGHRLHPITDRVAQLGGLARIIYNPHPKENPYGR
jgi:hypothetical protein